MKLIFKSKRMYLQWKNSELSISLSYSEMADENCRYAASQSSQLRSPASLVRRVRSVNPA